MGSDINSNYDVLSKNAERVNQAKASLANEEKGLILEKDHIREENEKDLSLIRDRAKRAVDYATRVGEEERQKVVSLNEQNYDTLNKQNLSRMENLTNQTAKDFETLNQRSLKQLHDFDAANVQKLLENTTRAEDSFYRAKQFSTEIKEQEDHYDVKIKLPPYEARNVMISGTSNQLKISFSRHYEGDTPIGENRMNTTRESESVTETYLLPTNINFKKVLRVYADGVLTLTIAKANPLQFDTEGAKKIQAAAANVESTSDRKASS